MIQRVVSKRQNEQNFIFYLDFFIENNLAQKKIFWSLNSQNKKIDKIFKIQSLGSIYKLWLGHYRNLANLVYLLKYAFLEFKAVYIEITVLDLEV